MTRLATATALLLVLALACLPAPASAQGSLVPQAAMPAGPDEPPPGFRLTPRQARAIADRQPDVREETAGQTGLEVVTQVPLTFGDGRTYQVLYLDGDDVVADVYVDGLGGEVREVWTGPQADAPLARGEGPSVARSLNELYVWLPLALLFLLPFLDPRRPGRLIHLDLAVLLCFGISQAFFNAGRVDVSVPLVYPLLAYLLLRMLLAGFRPRERHERLVPYARESWLLAGLMALVVFRIVLNVVDSHVIDVGFASVVGADRIAHGEELYVLNDVYGDTYGPVNYLAYLPFELLFPFDGTWGSVPAAHAAAITFDLLVLAGLFVVGRRMASGGEGRRLGLALAFAWAAYPFSLYSLQANTNDGLIAALLVWTLVALGSPAARGIAIGLATAAKFAPLPLVPLFATGTGDRLRMLSWPVFAAAFGGTVALAVLLYLPDGGLREFYDATIGFQLGRPSPFSLWGLHASLAPVQDLLKVAAVVLAVAVAFVPGRRDLRQVAALAAAVLIAVQLPATHWFYFYLVWVVPLALVAMFGAYRPRWTDGLGLEPIRAKEFASDGRSPVRSQRPRCERQTHREVEAQSSGGP